MLFYEAPEPEYNENAILNQKMVILLELRDVFLIQRHYRHSAISQQAEESARLQSEIDFLCKLVRIIDNVLIKRFEQASSQRQANLKSLIQALDLDGIFPGHYFDWEGSFDDRYSIVKAANKLFSNYSKQVNDDWKFL